MTAAMFQTMQETMKDHQQEQLSMDDVTAMIAEQIGKLLPMDEETTEQFQQLAKKMIEQAEKGENSVVYSKELKNAQIALRKDITVSVFQRNMRMIFRL